MGGKRTLAAECKVKDAANDCDARRHDEPIEKRLVVSPETLPICGRTTIDEHASHDKQSKNTNGERCNIHLSIVGHLPTGRNVRDGLKVAARRLVAGMGGEPTCAADNIADYAGNAHDRDRR